jgi:hypothetical protein
MSKDDYMIKKMSFEIIQGEWYDKFPKKQITHISVPQIFWNYYCKFFICYIIHEVTMSLGHSLRPFKS